MGAVIPRGAFARVRLLGLCAAILLGSCGPPDRQSADALVGHWLGNASYRDATVRLELDVERRGDSLAARITSDELLIRDSPIATFAYAEPRVHFVIPDEEAPLTFDGWLRRNLIVGAFTSSRFPHPERKATLPQLSLRRTYPSTFPYRVDTLRFAGSGVWLAGRLYTPLTQGPNPGVVLMQGSTQNLGASLNALADRFARAGFVAIVYDKRGSGASSGDPDGYTLADLVADAGGAFRLLRSRPDVDSTHVGFWGLSQGAFLAPQVAMANRAAFVVAVSGPAWTLGENFAWQDSVRGRPTRGGRYPQWFVQARATDPLPSWRALRVPVLAIYGERDELVPGPRSAATLEATLRGARHPDATVRVFPRANHVLKLQPSGAEPFDWPREVPGAVDTMVSWMRVRAIAR